MSETNYYDVERVGIEINHNMLVKSYYDIYSYIDQHNKQFQDGLELERIFKTHN